MAYPTSGARNPFLPVTAGASVSSSQENTTGNALCAYKQITTTPSPIGTTFSAVTGINATGFTVAANRFIKITIQAAGFALGGTGTCTVDFIIYDEVGAVALTSVIVANSLAVGQNVPGAQCIAYHQPGAGTVSYSAAIQVVAGSGSPTCAPIATTGGSHGQRTAFILVEDVGSAY
jgi:hypothetical protein